ncbi:MFS transporter [Vibrio crassostreae]|uniref:MFS transporter n=1 Tax=Vibrio crassostreae TaxID=246167 RepID=UPI000F4A0666|nr:MFS transporter [Vibrio crassostreae]ROP15519.1 putative MFS family arabinose efflux permease [Vibrio crassostreae]ROP20813.1 putative MFS family arabinose efflux permease [Vibrio crassostreae]RPE92527.1 putative MFS family arabinose efflux permease [Vibrio crassostreae]TCN67036.1 putative MFS family arabinose efflux permease [Vibrio crassostreae]TCV21686.1 putative MFS family arabinose efflux permease [Vibrio crassostreae]
MFDRTASWKTPQNFLLLISIVVPIAFSSWMALLNNFVIEKANFDGADIGLLQSVREIPGFLAFTVVFVLAFVREQRFMLISLAMLTVGTAITGLFPSLTGLLLTTILMSTGFHYFETLKQSLSLQWLSKEEAPEMLGKMNSVGALASLLTYGSIWVMLEQLKLDFAWVYGITGGLGFILVLVMTFGFPEFQTKTPQNKKLVLRKRYWLYYALTFMSGARRQIFTVFAGFLMVEKFGYSAADITLLFLINYLFNFLFAKRIGKFIGVVGERKALIFEYVGLIGVFVGYGLVQSAEWAAALYVVDHLFFALALAIKTYFQKIADPADMASTAGVSFTINHIAAVVIPVVFGVIWLSSPATVFYIGAAMAAISLALSLNIPKTPEEGNEVRMFSWR